MDNGINFDNFKQVCELAVNDNNVFRIFKHHPIYTAILEHVSYEQGVKYFNNIKENNPQLLSQSMIDLFKLNDNIGSPVRYYYGMNELSPTILRYVNVLSDLIIFFGDLNNKRIVEIGGGNGGLCSIISRVFNFKEYVLVDLPEVLRLQKKCLDILDIKKVSYLTSDDIYYLTKDVDLVISNYAFSECPDNIKDLYIDNVLLISKFGYLTMNRENETQYQKVFLDKIKNKNPIIIEEKPKTAIDNYIVMWK